MFAFDKTIYETLKSKALRQEKIFDADSLLYYGKLDPMCLDTFESQFDLLIQNKEKRDKLVISLDTTGGSAEFVERLVDMIRAHYEEVYFVISREAMSAGTIFACAGDRIYMSFKSALGPIDPQVIARDNRKWIPAQGYLESFEKLVEKSMKGTLSPIEAQMALQFDPADLIYYEQAKNLTVTLLKKWLVQYKFKDWDKHKNGKEVIYTEKVNRAEEIATMLGNNSKWHSHARFIGMKSLREDVKLRIDDYYTFGKEAANDIEVYSALAAEYSQRMQFNAFIHTRHTPYIS